MCDRNDYGRLIVVLVTTLVCDCNYTLKDAIYLCVGDTVQRQVDVVLKVDFLVEQATLAVMRDGSDGGTSHKRLQV
jgi:hypothetical protein